MQPLRARQHTRHERHYRLQTIQRRLAKLSQLGRQQVLNAASSLAAWMPPLASPAIDQAGTSNEAKENDN